MTFCCELLLSSLLSETNGNTVNPLDIGIHYNSQILHIGILICMKSKCSKCAFIITGQNVGKQMLSLKKRVHCVACYHIFFLVRSSLEQAGWAIEKLKLDLSEANTRNSMLAKEVDERHASMEKSSQSKLL